MAEDTFDDGIDRMLALGEQGRAAWLAAHDRQVRAQALRNAADRCYDDSGEGTRVAAWLRDRADAEERGE